MFDELDSRVTPEPTSGCWLWTVNRKTIYNIEHGKTRVSLG